MGAYQVLYNDIFTKLESLSFIKTVDDYNEQYENAEDYNLVKYPVCYVEENGVEWDKNENSFYSKSTEPQTGIGEIVVHVVFHSLKSFNKETKKEVNDLVFKVSNALQKLQCGNNDNGTYSTLMRIREEYITPSKQLRVAKLTFSTNIKDVFLEKTDIVEEVVSASFNIDFVEIVPVDALMDNNYEYVFDENFGYIITNG